MSKETNVPARYLLVAYRRIKIAADSRIYVDGMRNAAEIRVCFDGTEEGDLENVLRDQWPEVFSDRKVTRNLIIRLARHELQELHHDTYLFLYRIFPPYRKNGLLASQCYMRFHAGNSDLEEDYPFVLFNFQTDKESNQGMGGISYQTKEEAKAELAIRRREELVSSEHFAYLIYDILDRKEIGKGFCS